MNVGSFFKFSVSLVYSCPVFTFILRIEDLMLHCLCWVLTPPYFEANFKACILKDSGVLPPPVTCCSGRLWQLHGCSGSLDNNNSVLSLEKKAILSQRKHLLLFTDSSWVHQSFEEYIHNSSYSLTRILNPRLEKKISIGNWLISVTTENSPDGNSLNHFRIRTTSWCINDMSEQFNHLNRKHKASFAVVGKIGEWLGQNQSELQWIGAAAW